MSHAATCLPFSEMPPEYGYHLLKVALASYKKDPGQLDPEELHEARRKADRSFEIESLALTSPEAGDLVVSEFQVEAAVREITARYRSPDEFAVDLARNGLDEEVLRRALQRELRFDGVMQRVGSRRPDVSDLDVCLFYEMHRERFEQPERRTARHILITVNPDYPENARDAALARIEHVSEKLGGRANRFASLARKHSECPSALEGGKLGNVVAGQLYPELDAALFNLAEGEISAIVESEVGFHILWCEKVAPGKTLKLAKVRTQIVELLQARKQRNCQKAWLADLKKARAGT